MGTHTETSHHSHVVRGVAGELWFKNIPVAAGSLLSWSAQRLGPRNLCDVLFKPRFDRIRTRRSMVDRAGDRCKKLTWAYYFFCG